MADFKQALLWILPTYAIALYFFRVTGFLVWTVIVLAILVGLSVHESGTETATTTTRSKSKKQRKNEVPMVEYSDLVVTRIAPKKKKKWEKKIARYSKLDRKRR